MCKCTGELIDSPTTVTWYAQDLWTDQYGWLSCQLIRVAEFATRERCPFSDIRKLGFHWQTVRSLPQPTQIRLFPRFSRRYYLNWYNTQTLLPQQPGEDFKDDKSHTIPSHPPASQQARSSSPSRETSAINHHSHLSTHYTNKPHQDPGLANCNTAAFTVSTY